MNSTISDDLTREHLASEAANAIGSILEKTKNVTSLHKELLEINLSIIAYVEESQRRLDAHRLDQAHAAKSSHDVVKVLSENCENNMSIPPSPQKRSMRLNITPEDNNNTSKIVTDRQKAITFIQWYKNMIENDRRSLSLYLSEDVTLEWFGRTMKTRKKVAGFLKTDMHDSRYDFTTVESIEKIQTRQESVQRKDDDTCLASPLHSPELVKSKPERTGTKRRLLLSSGSSPEWAEGCKPTNDLTEWKRLKPNIPEFKKDQKPGSKREHPDADITNQGDCVLRKKRKCLPVTPTNHEVGQGDCLPSTSTESDKSHDALNAQLPKSAVECNCFLECTRVRNSRSKDAMTWERKCKVQISYSEDPLNVGEYIIWAMRYFDESKCRRNLLAAFEEVAIEEGLKKSPVK